MTEDRAPYSYTPDAVLGIAQRNKAPILMVDLPLTQRIQRHVIYDPSGAELAQFKLVSEALSNLVVNDTVHFLVDCTHWPRPFYCTISKNRRQARWPK